MATDVVDANEYLHEFLNSIDNLPSEIRHHSCELTSKEEEIQDILMEIAAREKRLFALMDGVDPETSEDSDSPFDETDDDDGDFYSDEKERQRPKKRRVVITEETESELIDKIHEGYNKARKLADEKSAIAEKIVQLVEYHIQRLDEDFDSLYPHYNLRESATADARSAADATNAITSSSSLLGQTSAGRGIVDTESQFSLPLLPNPQAAGSSRQVKGPGRRNNLNAAGRRSKQRSNYPGHPGDDITTQDIVQHFVHVDDLDTNEPVYCYCSQVSYGEMIGCDGENCPVEWFHLHCVGLAEAPKGKWYCNYCKEAKSNKKRKRGRPVGSTNSRGGMAQSSDGTTPHMPGDQGYGQTLGMHAQGGLRQAVSEVTSRSVTPSTSRATSPSMSRSSSQTSGVTTSSPSPSND